MNYLLCLALLLAGQSASAQSYFTAGGLRLGNTIGLTVQQRLAKRVTAELILNNRLDNSETLLTGLAEWHNPILTRRLNIYTGAGLHVGGREPAEGADKEGTYGLSFIGGAEFTIARLVLSFDFKPAIHLSGVGKAFDLQSDISVRYVFVKNKVYKDLAKNKKKRRKARDKERRRRAGDSPWWKVWE